MSVNDKISFNKGQKVFATRSSEGFTSTESNSPDAKYTLWVHRHPISSSSQKLYLDRIDLISKCGLPISKIWGFGLDERGHGWLATDEANKEDLLVSQKSSLEKLYVRAVQIVGALHEKGLVLGNICDSSFIVNHDAGTLLQAFLGEYEIAVQQTAKIPPKETFYYLAPEQRTANVNTFAADIYALGVLGYKLFTNDYPSASGNPLEPSDNLTSVVPPPSVISKESPVWLDDVLGTCLEQKAEKRYSDANKLIDVVRESLQTGKAPGGVSRWSKKTVMVDSKEILSSLTSKNDSENLEKSSPSSSDPQAQSPNEPVQESTSSSQLETRTIGSMIDEDSDVAAELPSALRTGLKVEDVNQNTKNLMKASFLNRVSGKTQDSENSEEGLHEEYEEGFEGGAFEEPFEEEKGLGSVFYFLSFFTAILFLGVIFLLTKSFLFSPNKKDTGNYANNLEVNEDLAPASLRPALNDLKAKGVSLEVKKAALKRIGQSEDDFAFNVLVSVVKAESGSELGVAAWEELMSQLARRDLKYSAKILNNWYKSMLAKGISPDVVVSKILKIVDKSLPLESRREELRSLFSKSPNLGLQYAAALSLDTKGDNSFTPLLRSFLKEKRGQTDLEDKSVYAIILSDKNLMYQFEGDIREFLKEFSDKDLAWGMSFLASQNSLLLKDVAAETLSREIVPRYEKEFVRAMSEIDHFELSKELKLALVRGAKGESKIEDVTALGNWYNMESERLLLVISATAESEKMRKSAFSKLSKKSMSREPSRSLFKWVKRNKWKKRGKLAKPIAILSLQDIANDKEIEDAFNKLVPYFGDGSIYKLFNKIGDKKLSYMALDKLGLVLPDNVLLDLLGDPNKKVRIKAVEALKGRNGLNLLQAIKKAYEKEKDAEVRKVYEEVHWVVKGQTRR